MSDDNTNEFAPELVQDSAIEDSVDEIDADEFNDDDFADAEVDTDEAEVDEDEDLGDEESDDEDSDIESLDDDEEAQDTVFNSNEADVTDYLDVVSTDSALALFALPTTGEPRVDDALGRLADLESLPVHEHVEVFEDVQRRLHDTLADLAGS